jgi:hypothetical protein
MTTRDSHTPRRDDHRYLYELDAADREMLGERPGREAS